MPTRSVNALAAAGLAVMLNGCVAYQVRVNTLQMVDSVQHVREVQVLNNIAAAISDHDMVPTQILLSTGQATVATGMTPSLKMPQFTLHPTTKNQEFDVSATDTWTAQWQVSPVTNGDDLRRLRNLYVLITSTDQQYNDLEAYYNRHPNMRAAAECYGLETPSQGFPSSATSTSPGASPSSAPTPSEATASEAAAPASPPPGPNSKVVACPPGYGAGQIPKWKEALEVIENGDSIDCKLYQEAAADIRQRAAHDATKGVPFRRWLYWKSPGGDWLPNAPDSEPELLGFYGGWEIGITSRACFDDFLILAQSATPATANESSGGARVMLNSQP